MAIGGWLRSFLFCLLTLLLLVSGCSRPSGPAPAARNEGPSGLLVAAASDLARVQVPLGQSFERISGVSVSFVLGSSGILARQVEQGAPYDVFLSANERFVTQLAESGKLRPQTVRLYALGRLAVWSRSGALKDLDDLTSENVRQVSIANPAHAPYGAAAQEAFARLSLWRDLERKVVYAENVRQALQFAESGNVDAAITSWSLVFDKGGSLVPADLHTPIRQSGGALASSQRPALAAQFMEFLVSKAGRAILQQHGLGVPEEGK